MNIFNKVTLKSLQKSKVRTSVTIIGIALSAAMICAVTTSVASFQNFLLQNYIYSDGSWHGSTVADSGTLKKSVIRSGFRRRYRGNTWDMPRRRDAKIPTNPIFIWWEQATAFPR